MSRVTRREWYERVNAAWPAEVPPLTAEEAERAVRKLYRYVTGRLPTWEFRITKGRRDGGQGHQLTSDLKYRRVYRVNLQLGWQALVHILSHTLCHEPHGAKHARLELRMIKEVMRRGWLTGALKAEPKPPIMRDLKAERYARTLELEKIWARKLKLAQTKLRKLAARRRGYERAAA